jgi:electron transport complex protein RnfE
MAKSLTHEFVKGLWEEVPPFRLVLGLCPTLAVTKAVENGIGMGVATTFVLVFSNMLVSSLRNVIPSKVRLASYIVIIATFVTIAEMVMKAYSYPMFKKLGIFIPLIVVNCIIFGRAEAFASKNGIFRSMLDGLGFGIGFTFALMALAAVRELLGTGALTFWEKPIQVFGPAFQPFSFIVEAPGAFMALGLMLCLMNLVGKK